MKREKKNVLASLLAAGLLFGLSATASASTLLAGESAKLRSSEYTKVQSALTQVGLEAHILTVDGDDFVVRIGDSSRYPGDPGGPN